MTDIQNMIPSVISVTLSSSHGAFWVGLQMPSPSSSWGPPARSPRGRMWHSFGPWAGQDGGLGCGNQQPHSGLPTAMFWFSLTRRSPQGVTFPEWTSLHGMAPSCISPSTGVSKSLWPEKKVLDDRSYFFIFQNLMDYLTFKFLFLNLFLLFCKGFSLCTA